MSDQKQITIVDTTIPVVEYQGQRVVTFETIDRLHQRPPGTAKRNFTDNKERFQEGKHFYVIDYSQKNEFRTFEIEIPPRGLTVITERGYSMLVKSFTDDFAWDIQEQLSDSYFNKHQSMSTAEFLVKQANLMLEHEKRIRRVEQKQIDTDVKIAETRSDLQRVDEMSIEAFQAAQAALQHKFGDPQYCTLMAYFSSRCESLPLEQAKVYGMQASKLSRERDLALHKIPDARFGTVNAYHVSVLEIIFKQHLQPMTLEDLTRKK